MSSFISSSTISGAVRRQHISKKSVAIRNRHIRRMIILLSVAAVLALSFVWTRVRVIQLGYEVTRLHKEVVDLEQKRAEIVADVARLKSPDRLEKVAQELFGMRLPRGNEIVFVDE